MEWVLEQSRQHRKTQKKKKKEKERKEKRKKERGRKKEKKERKKERKKETLLVDHWGEKAIQNDYILLGTHLFQSISSKV